MVAAIFRNTGLHGGTLPLPGIFNNKPGRWRVDAAEGVCRCVIISAFVKSLNILSFVWFLSRIMHCRGFQCFLLFSFSCVFL